MITELMAEKARKIVEQHLNENDEYDNSPTVLNDSNSNVIFVTGPKDPYFIVAFHNISAWTDGVYTVVEDDEGEMLIGNNMDVYDPEEWEIDDDEEETEEETDESKSVPVPNPVSLPGKMYPKSVDPNFDEPFFIRWIHKLLGS